MVFDPRKELPVDVVEPPAVSHVEPEVVSEEAAAEPEIQLAPASEPIAAEPAQVQEIVTEPVMIEP